MGTLKRAARALPLPAQNVARGAYRAASPALGAINRGRDRLVLHRRDAELPGSTAWLIGREAKYGGKVTNVPRLRVSDHDPRRAEDIRTGGMTGGDRMSFVTNAYGRPYGKLLASRGAAVVVEIGILTGVGLAIWCDLFPDGRVIGLDIDPCHFQRNRATLEDLGAFRRNGPEEHVYDQLGPASQLDPIFATTEVDLVIDDGLHTEQAIVSSLHHFRPRMARDFLYIIEDNAESLGAARRAVPEWRWSREGGLVVGRP